MPNIVVHLIKKTLLNCSFPDGENQLPPNPQKEELNTITGTVACRMRLMHWKCKLLVEDGSVVEARITTFSFPIKYVIHVLFRQLHGMLLVNRCRSLLGMYVSSDHIEVT